MGTGRLLTEITKLLLETKTKWTAFELKDKINASSYDNVRRALFRLWKDGLIKPDVEGDEEHQKFKIVYSIKEYRTNPC